MSKKRAIVSYEKLTPEQKKELLEINVYDLLASMKESEM
jgi:hypothetical protein